MRNIRAIQGLTAKIYEKGAKISPNTCDREESIGISMWKEKQSGEAGKRTRTH